MTATVVSLESRRRNPAPACNCARHQLEGLVNRAQHRIADTAGELLIGRDVLAALVDDIAATVEQSIATNRRTKP